MHQRADMAHQMNNYHQQQQLLQQQLSIQQQLEQRQSSFSCQPRSAAHYHHQHQQQPPSVIPAMPIPSVAMPNTAFVAQPGLSAFSGQHLRRQSESDVPLHPLPYHHHQHNNLHVPTPDVSPQRMQHYNAVYHGSHVSSASMRPPPAPVQKLPAREQVVEKVPETSSYALCGIYLFFSILLKAMDADYLSLLEYLALLVIKTFGNGGQKDPHSSSHITATHNFVDFRNFIYTLLNRTAISFNTVTLAMMYLQRLKKCHPQCRSAAVVSSSRLMLAALIVAHKVLMDDCFENKTWAKVSGFTTAEVNKMEQELLFFCNHDMHVPQSTFAQFQSRFMTSLQQCTQKLASFSNVAPIHAQTTPHATFSHSAHSITHYNGVEQTYPSPPSSSPKSFPQQKAHTIPFYQNDAQSLHQAPYISTAQRTH